MKFQIKVPATSANVGSGFDCAGIALSLFNTFEFDFDVKENSYINFEKQFSNDDNLVYKSIVECFKYLKKDIDFKICIKIDQNIPIANGLGSSSTCVVAGVCAALKYIYGELDINLAKLICSKIEKHPDNVIPAIIGGLSTSLITEDKKVYSNHIELDNDYNFIAITPPYPSFTSKAREVLPKNISIENAIFNWSRLSLLIKAFESKDIDLIKEVTKDRIHQIYRLELIIEWNKIKLLLEELNMITWFISGAGGTICIVCDNKNLDNNLDIIKRCSAINNFIINNLKAYNQKLEIIDL